ncbi:iron(III) transport system permease protein [Rhodoglobus vestalii]|uniref:Iron(III) transport system permease protein n=1 Tax=Rhodoglobus vestalii TaxID=193384 RepID=A0A8H2K7P6_9MICO|nr:iron ABC transporter permease [Rhodoglobus vestalii]TQO19547.1 iron(III) transport system permease protein [Rhodoglobus vestalii]
MTRTSRATRASTTTTTPPSPGLLVVVVVLAIGMLIPVGYVIEATARIGLDELGALLLRPRVGELLTNTVLIVLLAVPLTIVLGVGSAWLVERTDLPGRRFFAVLCVAPLAIPSFVSSYGWASIVPSIQGLGGGLLVATLAYYPLVYLPALATLRGLNPSLEESARSLGLTEGAILLRVVIPQLRLAILGGGLIVALHLLAEYGAFAFIRFDTFTTAIVVAYQSTFAGPSAASLGIVLALLSIIVLAIEATARGRARYAYVGSSSATQAQPIALGRFTPVAILSVTALGALATVVPMASVIRWSFAAKPDMLDGLWRALVDTSLLSLSGAVGAVLVALPIAWLATRHPSRLSKTLEGGYSIASSLPAIIVALALVTVTLNVAPAIYQTAATVTAAYVIIFLPRALVTLRAGLAQVPESLEEAARALGTPPLLARLRVTLPLLLPAIAAAGALVALGAANELTATLLLAPTGTRTLATQFWSAASSIDYPGAAPYAITLVLLSIPAVALLFAQTGSKAR